MIYIKFEFVILIKKTIPLTIVALKIVKYTNNHIMLWLKDTTKPSPNK